MRLGGQATATFSNGEAKSIGMLSLYFDRLHSWMIEPGMTGEIRFETGAERVSFWFRNRFSSNQGVVRAFDAGNEIIATMDATTSFRSFELDSGSMSAVVRITVANNGASGQVVVDQLSFCAAGGEPSTTSTSTSTSTSTTSGAPLCGDADGNGTISASDALAILQVVIGLRQCEPCICAVSGGAEPTATDALAVLRASVGLEFEPACSSCA